ncbi:MAG: flavin oxidoreductase/NADH oxidase [Defluviitaleaceae bacterium]|nr:flavin oxidoreductase/NADH oxidase [Defluviitaleaceae bacterium]
MSKPLPFSSNTGILAQPLTVGAHTFPNRLAIQPMEGCDSTTDGTPGELSFRRYRRYAAGGAGLIWIEAVAVVNEGRANPWHMYINKNNVDTYARLVSEIRETALKECGINPVLILQATHAGRYSKPHGTERIPVIARNNPIFEGDTALPAECIISDDELKALEEDFASASVLTQQAGFDGVDIKACHGYLVSELLASHTRPGLYGGDFENRTRFMRNTFDAVRAVVNKSFMVTSRMNIYDAYPYPYGFGVTQGRDIEPDLSETIRLLEIIKPELLNITMGNPYQNSHVNRPGDIQGVERMCNLTRDIQIAFPDMAVVGSGVSFLKERSGELAAGYVETGVCKIVGWGRMSFAYPNFARDILAGNFDKKQTCLCCAGCTKLMRAGQSTGCAIRDDVYNQLFKQHCTAN